MISYELHGYNSITLVILYMTNNIYIRAFIYDRSALRIICVVHIQLRGHISVEIFLRYTAVIADFSLKATSLQAELSVVGDCTNKVSVEN